MANPCQCTPDPGRAEATSSVPPGGDLLNRAERGETEPWFTPRNLTWNKKISPWKRKVLLETIIFRFHVKFRGCNGFFCTKLAALEEMTIFLDWVVRSSPVPGCNSEKNEGL